MSETIQLRIGFTCLACGEHRTRRVYVGQVADSGAYMIDGDAYRVCVECTSKSDATTLARNIRARRALVHADPNDNDAIAAAIDTAASIPERPPRRLPAILRNLALSTHPETLTREERAMLAEMAHSYAEFQASILTTKRAT